MSKGVMYYLGHMLCTAGWLTMLAYWICAAIDDFVSPPSEYLLGSILCGTIPGVMLLYIDNRRFMRAQRERSAALEAAYWVEQSLPIAEEIQEGPIVVGCDGYC